MAWTRFDMEKNSTLRNETESIAKNVHGEGIEKKRIEMRGSGEESVEVKGKRLAYI